MANLISSLLEFICSLSTGNSDSEIQESMGNLEHKKHYPLRGMPIHIQPDFDEPMIDMWMALGE